MERQFLAIFEGTVVWPTRSCSHQVHRREMASMVFAVSVSGCEATEAVCEGLGMLKVVLDHPTFEGALDGATRYDGGRARSRGCQRIGCVCDRIGCVIARRS